MTNEEEFYDNEFEDDDEEMDDDFDFDKSKTYYCSECATELNINSYTITVIDESLCVECPSCTCLTII